MNQFSSQQKSLPEQGVPGNIEAESTAAIGAGGAAGIATVEKGTAVTGRARDFWLPLVGNPKVLIGGVIVLLFILIALFGPFFVHGDPGTVTDEILLPPSSAHWLGTTAFGQDVLAQLIVGTRSSVFWGLLTGIIVTILSVFVGLVGGNAGGVVDELLSLLSNVFLILPSLPLAIIMAAYFPIKGDLTVAIVLVITGWSWQARVLRAQTLSVRNREFVTAARSCGESTWRIIFYEILPNEFPIVVAGFINTVISVILAAAGLQFLGLGDSRSINWGSMLYWAQNNSALVQGAWWWFMPPGICVALLGAALALINFGMDDIANPRLSSQKKLRKNKKIQRTQNKQAGSGQ